MTTDFDRAWSRLPAALQAHPGIKDLQRAHLAALAARKQEAWKCESVSANHSKETTTVEARTCEYVVIPPAAPQD